MGFADVSSCKVETEELFARKVSRVAGVKAASTTFTEDFCTLLELSVKHVTEELFVLSVSLIAEVRLPNIPFLATSGLSIDFGESGSEDTELWLPNDT